MKRKVFYTVFFIVLVLMSVFAVRGFIYQGQLREQRVENESWQLQYEQVKEKNDDLQEQADQASEQVKQLEEQLDTDQETDQGTDQDTDQETDRGTDQDTDQETDRDTVQETGGDKTDSEKPVQDMPDDTKDETVESADEVAVQKGKEENRAVQLFLEQFETVEAGTVVTKDQIDEERLDDYFCAYEISDAVFDRIYGKSYKEYCTVPREDLRYLKVLHIGYDGEVHVGELMVNVALAEDFTDIFKELYLDGYEIEKMFLVDNYGADDDTSIDDNNTSCFNFRYITGSSTELSNHATGCAIDVNPLQNPYATFSDGVPACARDSDYDYLNRTDGKAHMIVSGDLCWQAFTERGFTWGGDWANPVDYQHFEKDIVSYD